MVVGLKKMIKIDVFCEDCNKEYIVVFRDGDDDVIYCPVCGVLLSSESDDYEDYEDYE